MSKSAVPFLFKLFAVLQPCTLKNYQVTSAKDCEGTGFKALEGTLGQGHSVFTPFFFYSN